MLIIGERINGMFQDVKKAIQTKDKTIIQNLARRQVAAGAQVLDVNVGPASSDQIGTMKWLVEIIQEVVDVTLALDSSKPAVIKEAIGLCKKPVFINSTTAQKEKLDVLLSLAVEKEASLIGLTMDEKGIPRDADSRAEMAVKIVTEAAEKGLPMERLYLDPIILPCNVAQAQALQVLETIRQIKILASPPPRTVLGLSNVSQGTPHRPLINRIYLVMAMAAGLDAAIVDPMDRELMEAAITAELLLNKTIYCDSFLGNIGDRKRLA
jgi:5-methyltetrahydrofolate corrinoid/iron sulfur protein methyltransferase